MVFSIFSLKLHEKRNIVLLIQELNEEFKLYNLTLTASFSGLKETLADALDYHSMFEFFEFIQFTMSNYIDLFTENATKKFGVSDLDDTIERIIKLGIPRKKVVIGIFQFGGAEADVLKAAYVSRPCEEIKNSAALHCPYKKNILGDRIRDGRIDFEPARSVANKIRMIVKRRLLGVMTTVIYMDDLLGRNELESNTFDDFRPIQGVTLNIPKCINVHYPLLKTINLSIRITRDELDQQYRLQMKKFNSK